MAQTTASLAFTIFLVKVSLSQPKPAAGYCYTGCDYRSIWDQITQSCRPFLLNQSEDPTGECYSVCEVLTSERLSCACNSCPSYVRGFNMTRFLMLANDINPRFGAPNCCECEGSRKLRSVKFQCHLASATYTVFQGTE